jgi:hypothetical protein
MQIAGLQSWNKGKTSETTTGRLAPSQGRVQNVSDGVKKAMFWQQCD